MDDKVAIFPVVKDASDVFHVAASEELSAVFLEMDDSLKVVYNHLVDAIVYCEDVTTPEARRNMNWERMITNAIIWHPRLGRALRDVADKFPYGGYVQSNTEKTHTLTKNLPKDHKKEDMPSKFGYVDFGEVSDTLLKIIQDCNSHIAWGHFVRINAACKAYKDALRAVEIDLMRSFSEMYNIDLKVGSGIFRALSYKTNGHDELAMGAHIDMTFATLIGNDFGQGLQAMIRNEWYKVNIPKGCLCVQFGWFTELLSGGQIPAMLHCVKMDIPTHRICLIEFMDLPDDTELTFHSYLCNEGMTREEAYEKLVSEDTMYTRYPEIFEGPDDIINVRIAHKWVEKHLHGYEN